MAAKNNNLEFLDASELITKYPGLTQSTMRELFATFVTDHLYLTHKTMQSQQGNTPFPATQWQSWDNLTKDKPEITAPEKVNMPKTREIKQFDKDGTTPLYNKDGKQKVKKEKIEGEFELKEKRLRKITTFNAPGKSALAFVIAQIVHETAMAEHKITKSDDSSIKDAIMSAEDCNYRIAPAIFAMCDQCDDATIKDNLPKTQGTLQNKLEIIIDKVVNDTCIRNVLVASIMKFLRIFTLDLASDLWYETKETKEVKDEDEDEVDDDREKVVSGKGTTTSDKQIRQALSRISNKHLSGDDKLTGDFFTGMDEFYDAIQAVDQIKKDENKKKRAENTEKKKTEDAKKKIDAKDATESGDDVPEVKEVKPAKEKAVKEAKEPEVESPPEVVDAPAAPAVRRRRGAK